MKGVWQTQSRGLIEAKTLHAALASLRNISWLIAP